MNNNIEFDHDKLKFLIKPKSGFMKTAYTTIKGSEVMRVFKKGGFDFWKYGQGVFLLVSYLGTNPFLLFICNTSKPEGMIDSINAQKTKNIVLSIFLLT